MTSPAPLVEYRGVEKRYAATGAAAVDGLDLAIREGEFLTLLGPSGSGKTTALMMLAGFEMPSAGDILLRGRSLAGMPPHRRNMGVVFQSYALFPHMTVAQNLAFPLNVRGIRGRAAAEKVEEALALVRLEGLGHRRPNALSGGQRQRVALARALIFNPDIVLMDEPLGALDRQLRERLQEEIKRVQRALNLTIVYVTHDQDEALTLSDRVAVFADGRVQQLGTPEAIYERPANRFVAGFVGDNNGLPGTVKACNGARCEVVLEGGQTILATPVGPVAPGGRVLTTVRPEHVEIGGACGTGGNRMSARVEELIYHGDHSRIRATLPGGALLTIRAPCATALRPADPLPVGWSADRCFAFPDVGRADDPLQEAQ